MIEKIIYSMFHGNMKTKLFLWSVVVLAVGALFLLMTAIVLGIPYLGMGGIGMGMVSLIVSQSVSLNTLQRQTKPKVEKKQNSEHSLPGEKKTDNSEEDLQENTEEGRRKKNRQKAQYYASFDSKKMKKTLKEHKVNQIHVKVMIDSFPKKNIEQCPAFLWRTDTMLHFLVLEEKAYEFEVPLADIKNILYVKNIPVNTKKDYLPYRYSNFLTKMFQQYLPEYHEGTNGGKLTVTKNTFRIEPGIYFTNSCIGEVRKVLLSEVAFVVDDQVTASKRFNEYFKELYRESILCKNQVINIEQYKQSVEKTLNAFLDAPVDANEFASTLYDLHKYHLITREYVVRYSQEYKEKHFN